MIYAVLRKYFQKKVRRILFHENSLNSLNSC